MDEINIEGNINIFIPTSTIVPSELPACAVFHVTKLTQIPCPV
jgi:hypothetical protein